MVSRERALQLIQESMNALQRARLIEEEVIVREDTVLFGQGSALDSLAFVTFVTELEDRLNLETNQEMYLVLDNIHEFNADAPYLSAGTLAGYIVRMTEEEERS